MILSYLTLFPQLIDNYWDEAFIKKASNMGLLQKNIINLRDFSDNTYKSVDDKPYGGGDGMLLRADIIEKALYHTSQIKTEKTLKIYFSPQGQKLSHSYLENFLNYDHLILLCGRYAGVDQRVVDLHFDLELSLGDFVLSGGELPALVLTESLARLFPGVLNDHLSAVQDSHVRGLLEAPQFTKPLIYNEVAVPEVLTLGHHQKILEWKFHTSLMITWKKRKDLFLTYALANIESYLNQAVNKKSRQKFYDEHLLFLRAFPLSELKSISWTSEDLDNYFEFVAQFFKGASS